MTRTTKAESRAKKAPARPRRKPAQKAVGPSPAELAEYEVAAERLGAGLAQAFAPAPAPQPVICAAPSRWIEPGPIPATADKPIESAADLSCLQAYRSPRPIRAAFIREVIESDGPPDPGFVIFADGEALEFAHAMFARYVPKVGDAFVFYPDGHTAFLPRAEFNACYGKKPLGLWARVWSFLTFGGQPL